MKDLSTQKFTLLDIVKFGFNFIKKEYAGLIPILVVFYFPFGIITALTDFNTNGLQDLTPNHVFSFILMTLILTPLGTMSLTKFMKHRIEGETIAFHELSDYMITRYLPTVLIFILLILTCFPLFFLFIIPGLVAFIYLSFVIEIATLHKFSVVDTFQYSFNLVKNNWWFVFSITLFSMTASMITLRLISFIIDTFISGITGTILYYLISQILSLCMNILSISLFFNLEKTKKAQNQIQTN